jgi:hypothetical protein
MATISTLYKITDIYHLNVTFDNSQLLDINSAQKVINNDEGLDEREKEQAFMEYLQSGKYTKSMSQLISDSPSVTEMRLQKTEKWPLDEFQKQFDVQHLPHNIQKHAFKISKRELKFSANMKWILVAPMMLKWTLRLIVQNLKFRNIIHFP